jgi:PAS domain S-box-containing protein
MNLNGTRKVLFVDDDPDMLEIGGIILKKAGYEYASATSGQAGLNMMTREPPNLVILDYMMPGMDGHEFIRQLAQNHRYKSLRETPIVMLTAANEEDVNRQELFEMGLSAFLLKPFGNRELLNVIDNVFILNDLRQKNKELVEQVKRTEYKYQDLIENASDLIFTLDLEGNFVFINRRLNSSVGYDRDDWIGQKFPDLVVADDKEIAQVNFEQAINGKSRIFEVSVRPDPVTYVYLAINMNPIFERGKIVGCVAIARNITDKKTLEGQLIELKNFNESIIQSMGSGLLTADLEHRITSFNMGAEQALGYNSSDVIGQPLEEIFPDELCERLLSNVDDPDQGLLNRELQVVDKLGHPVFIGFTVTPRYDLHNRRVGTIISFRDITQIKQMQAEVQRMDRLASMGVLASGIAHEIRNPLAGIKTIAQTLEEEIEPDDLKREYVSRIVRQVNRMDDLLKTIFSYAKPREPKRRPIGLQEIIQEVVALVENRMRNQNVDFKEIYDPKLSTVYVDFYQIQQVFVNLFLNALDAMPDGGELRLEALPKVATLRRVDRRGQSFPIQNKSANYVEVTVSDTGVGINQEALPSIFNPFFTTKPQGSGLGLSIVYRIMTEHHGEIHVDSEPNKGTTFSVLLPTEE